MKCLLSYYVFPKNSGKISLNNLKVLAEQQQAIPKLSYKIALSHFEKNENMSFNGSKVQLMRLFDTSTTLKKCRMSQTQELKCQHYENWVLFCFLSKITFLPYLEALVSVSVECCP